MIYPCWYCAQDLKEINVYNSLIYNMIYFECDNCNIVFRTEGAYENIIIYKLKISLHKDIMYAIFSDTEFYISLINHDPIKIKLDWLNLNLFEFREKAQKLLTFI